MGTCPAVRLGAAAVAGYALGSISGSAAVAWLLAAAAVGVAYVWGRVRSRRSGASCGLGLRCGPPPAEAERPAAGPADAVHDSGSAAAPSSGTGGEPGADAGSRQAGLGEPVRR